MSGQTINSLWAWEDLLMAQRLLTRNKKILFRVGERNYRAMLTDLKINIAPQPIYSKIILDIENITKKTPSGQLEQWELILKGRLKIVLALGRKIPTLSTEKFVFQTKMISLFPGKVIKGEIFLE